MSGDFVAEWGSDDDGHPNDSATEEDDEMEVEMTLDGSGDEIEVEVSAGEEGPGELATCPQTDAAVDGRDDLAGEIEGVEVEGAQRLDA